MCAAPQSMLVKGEAPASVQCGALRALAQVLELIRAVPPSDAKMFLECAAAAKPPIRAPQGPAYESVLKQHRACLTAAVPQQCLLLPWHEQQWRSRGNGRCCISASLASPVGWRRRKGEQTRQCPCAQVHPAGAEPDPGRG